MAKNRYYEDEKSNYKFNASSLKKTLKYCVPYKKIIISMTVLMLVMSFVSLLPTMINAYIVDYVITEKGAFGLDWFTLAPDTRGRICARRNHGRAVQLFPHAVHE